MKTAKIWYWSVAIGAFLLKTALAQTIPNVPDLELSDTREIYKIGKNGERDKMPRLQEIFRSGEWEGRFSRSAAAQMALARLGDEVAMKSILCELHNDKNLDQQNDAFEKLRYVGGYTVIKILSGFLDNSKANTKIRLYPSDHGDYGTLRAQALPVLEGLAQTPFRLPPAMGAQEEGENRLMLRWLKEHDEELKSKMPVFPFDDVAPEECKQIEAELASDKRNKSAGSCGYLAEMIQFAESDDPNKTLKLQEVLRSGDRRECTRSGSAQIALAHTGDESAMKSLLCEVGDATDHDRQGEAFRKLGHVGGYTAIKVLSRFLSRPKANNQLRKDAAGNTEYSRVSQLAISAIATIIHQDPFHLPSPRSAREIEERAPLWRKWVEEHDADLRTLKPIFDFQDVGPAECKKVSEDLSQRREAK